MSSSSKMECFRRTRRRGKGEEMGLLLFCPMLFVLASSSSRNLLIIAFDQGYTPLYGNNNVDVRKDGKLVQLSPDHMFLWI